MWPLGGDVPTRAIRKQQQAGFGSVRLLLARPAVEPVGRLALANTLTDSGERRNLRCLE
jgi:hypothetical protein